MNAIAAPASLAPIGARVDDCIATMFDAEAVRWSALDPDLVAPLNALRDTVLDGGKRLRPAFCHWSFVGAGGDSDDARLTRAGAALELLHAFACIHDDVMDDSGRRHGSDTLHVEFARRHRHQAWHGDSQRFGAAAAIVLGDLVYVYSDMLLESAGSVARQVFNELRLEVNVGQYLDLLGTAQRRADAVEARRIGRYKTAKYTIERPLHLGVALAAPDRLDALAGPLSAYSLPLGEAFQLKDDLLGAFGDPTVTGKPTGGDLSEGKPTLLFALAHQSATGAGGRFLDERYGAADLDADEISTLQELFTATGAAARVADIISELLDESLAAAESLAITADARAALVELARFVAGREY